LSEAALEASQRAVARSREFADRLQSPTTHGATPAMAAAADDLELRVRNALFDDLNAPQAVAAVFDFLRAANADLDRRSRDSDGLERARQSVTFIEETLGIVPPVQSERGLVVLAPLGSPTSATTAPPDGGTDEAALRPWVEERLQARADARARRDFAAADAIRQELLSRGVTIADTGAGTSWKLKN
jgi:cysteinyl-tRNA synthetase